MDDKKDTKQKGLASDDAALWREMTGDVERLPGQDYQEPSPGSSKEASPVVRETIVPQGKPKKDVRERKSSELDRRTDERLRRGQMAVEARLDLHGFNQRDAQEALEKFILRCAEDQKRCVLIITGKGRAAPGILRQNVPAWLHEGALRGVVLKSYPAKPKDGGAGALYVYLRRPR